MVNRAAAANLAEQLPAAEADPAPDMVWLPPFQPGVLALPVIAVALSHDGRWNGKGEHAAQVIDGPGEDTAVSLMITPLHHQAVRALDVRHMSAVRPLDRWGWRHIGEEARERSLTAAPDAEQP